MKTDIYKVIPSPLFINEMIYLKHKCNYYRADINKLPFLSHRLFNCDISIRFLKKSQTLERKNHLGETWIYLDKLFNRIFRIRFSRL